MTSVKDCLKGIKKRMRTLLIPYIIWNLVFVGWYAVLAITPGISQFVNSNILGHLSVDHPLDSLRYLFMEPAGFHLWFLRDLIIYVMCTPLLYLMGKRFPIVSFFILLAVFGGFQRSGITYYFLGAVVSQRLGIAKFNTFFPNSIIVLFGFLFVANCVMATIPSCAIMVDNPYFQKLVNLSGIFFIWSLYDSLYKFDSSSNARRTLLLVSRFSFFIYLFHEPAFNIIKKITLRLVGVGGTQLVFLYFFNPIAMCIIAVGIGVLFHRTFPKLYSVCVGGR